MSTMMAERIIQKCSKEASRFVIPRDSPRTACVSRCVELEQSPAVVVANTGNSPATILKHCAKLPEVIMRRIVDGKLVIPREMV